MGGAVFPPCSLALTEVMVTSFKKDLCEHASAPSTVVVSDPDPVAGHCLTHASPGDTRALTGKPGSACCEVIAPFPGS